MTFFTFFFLEKKEACLPAGRQKFKGKRSFAVCPGSLEDEGFKGDVLVVLRGRHSKAPLFHVRKTISNRQVGVEPFARKKLEMLRM